MRDIYQCGGTRLATSLLEAGLIDEVLLKQNPVVFGTGIPLFHAVKSFEPLELLDTKVYANGVLLLRYAILKRERFTQEHQAGPQERGNEHSTRSHPRDGTLGVAAVSIDRP